jgi:hypothetical protein
MSRFQAGIDPFPTILSQVSQTAVRQEKKEKWKAKEGKLHVKWLKMDQAKVCRFPWHFYSFSADVLIYQRHG